MSLQEIKVKEPYNWKLDVKPKLKYDYTAMEDLLDKIHTSHSNRSHHTETVFSNELQYLRDIEFTRAIFVPSMNLYILSPTKKSIEFIREYLIKNKGLPFEEVIKSYEAKL